MRFYLAFVLALTGCASWHGPLDVITPDELTVGQGRGTHYGGIQTHSPEWEYEGESETTYAALTWDIPSFQDERLTQEERRAIRAANFAAEEQAEDSTSSQRVVKDPPKWLPYAMFGGLALFLCGVWLKSRRKDPWA